MGDEEMPVREEEDKASVLEEEKLVGEEGKNALE